MANYTEMTLSPQLDKAEFKLDTWNASGLPALMVISAAFHAGVDFEDLADGFGIGLGTRGGDWSGIRDSSTEAIAAMFQRAMNRMRFASDK